MFPPTPPSCCHFVVLYLCPGVWPLSLMRWHQVISLFPDLTLAVEEGEPDLAHDFFSTVKVSN